MVNHVLKHKGITLDRSGTEVHHTEGYYVSIAAIDRIAIKDLNESRINECLSALRSIYGHIDGVYLGIWINDEECYFDASIHITSKWHALRMGVVFKQLAIWDCKNSREVRV